MSKQQLLDYLKDQLTIYDNDITDQKKRIENLNLSINQQQQTINSLQKQKDQCDIDIATYESDKIYVNEIIVIIENS